MKLRRLLLSAFVAFAVVPVGLIGLLVWQGTNLRGERLAQETLLQTTQMEAQHLSDFFAHTITVAQLLAGTPGIADALKTPAPQSRAFSAAQNKLTAPLPSVQGEMGNVSRMLQQWAARLPEVQSIVLCNANFKLVSASEAGVDAADWTLTDLHQKNLRDGIPIVTSLTQGAASRAEKTFAVAAPVYEDDTILGYLILTMVQPYFDNIVRDFRLLESGSATLFDPNGIVVASGAGAEMNSLADFYAASDLARKLENDAVFTFRLRQEQHLGYYCTIDNASWGLLCMVRAQDYTVPPSNIVVTAAMILVVLACLTAILYRFVTRYFTTPLAVLERHIHEIDAGNYGNFVPHLGKTEFGEIGMAFNKMLTRIQKDRSELALKEEHHRILNEQSSGVIFEYHVDTHAVSTSPGGRVLAGFPASMAHFPDSLLEAGAVYEEETALLERQFRAMTLGQKSSAMDLRLKLQTGEWHWFCLLMTTISDTETKKPLRVVGKLTDVDEQRRRADSLTQKATRDPLTDLYNKSATQTRICELLGRTRAQDKIDALMVIDIDHFKRVNDGYGHQKGDSILQQIARAMQRQFRPSDIVGRIGGDEFMVLLCDMPDEESVVQRVCLLLADVRTVLLDAQTGETMSLSVGVVLSPRDGADFETLYARADSALYAAKNAGRNTYSVYKAAADAHENEEAKETL